MLAANSFLLLQVYAMYWWIVGGALFPARFFFRNPVVSTTLPTVLTSCVARGCGTCSNVSSTGGVLLSPNYPNNYGSNFNCTYVVSVPGGQKVQITFNEFIIETGVDLIVVNDGGAPGALNAINMNGYLLTPTITSLSNQITVEFQSFGVNNNIPPGVTPVWKATYLAVN